MFTSSHFIFPVNTFSFRIEKTLVYQCIAIVFKTKKFTVTLEYKKVCHSVIPVRQYGVSDFPVFALPLNACWLHGGTENAQVICKMLTTFMKIKFQLTTAGTDAVRCFCHIKSKH